MIEIINLNKTYDNKNKALKNINIRIEEGEFVFIMGRSGSGKSTLMKILLKEVEPTSGKVIVNDMELGKMPRRYVPKYRKMLGVVFQDFRLLKDMTVYENVAFAQRVLGIPTRKIKENVPAILRQVGLSSKYKSYPNQLSGGEQQRVAIARALINNPAVLLADEPTGNLDAQNSMEIMGLLEQINRRGTTVVVVTHSHEIVEKMGKRVITIDRGCVVSDEVMEPWDYGELKVEEIHSRRGPVVKESESTKRAARDEREKYERSVRRQAESRSGRGLGREEYGSGAKSYGGAMEVPVDSQSTDKTVSFSQVREQRGRDRGRGKQI
ncbi:UNVERIFIED_ORG: cell division ATP-binding protein FtsE [Lacrimispora saccharolytica]